jgi:hypothetical protein
VLAFYPQFGLKRSEPSLRTAIAPAQSQVALGRAEKLATAHGPRVVASR